MQNPRDKAGISGIDLQMLIDERVRERTAELTAVLQTTREGYATFRAGGAVTDVNEAYCRMVGYSREEILRMNVRDIDVAMDQSTITQIGSRIRTQGAASFETKHRRKDGRVIDIEATLDWIEIGGGRYVAFMHDITERKRAESSRAQLLAILEATPDVVGTANLEGRIQYVNPHGRRLLGLAEDEKPLIRDCHPAWAWDLLRDEGLPATLRDGMWTGETALLSRDGREIPVHQVVIAHRDEAGAATYFSMVARDMTDLRRTDQILRRRSGELRLRSNELAAAVRELERASRAKDEFLASMSHELRTPLNGILGMAEILRTGIYGPLTDRQFRSVQVIEDGGRHLLSLINDILDVAKIEAGQLVVHPEACSAAVIAESSLEMVRQAAERKKIQLTSAIDPSARTANADPRRLRQILANLLSNAVKFTPDGGRVSLEIRPDPARPELRFTVSDTGPGIAAADIPRLFQPFTQLDAGLARQHGGTGLGLTIVRRMTELHGGRVEVESVPGEGSRFTVALPWTADQIGTAAARPVEGPSASPAAPDPGAPSPLVLLVDDDENSIEILTGFLVAAGIRLAVAHSASEALDLAPKVRPDIVLTDIQLPGMDGLELIRRLRSADGGAAPRILALTALAMAGDRERILAAGADDYLSKPYSLRTVEARIRKLAPARPSPDR